MTEQLAEKADRTVQLLAEDVVEHLEIVWSAVTECLADFDEILT